MIFDNSTSQIEVQNGGSQPGAQEIISRILQIYTFCSKSPPPSAWSSVIIFVMNEM
jgi:hypothetical protein